MTRFEIQDISYQTIDGVTFRALDTVTGETVALRRFFPFGQDEEGGEGLDVQEGKAFASACLRLSQLRHPTLRRTIMGDIDPIDGMPYLVTEWLDGESLATILNGNLMDPASIINLTRQALEVCVVLSEALKNEAVWIDTKPDSIIVCNADTNPTFSFRICPFKWLGTQEHQKDLIGIVDMVEELIGWKSKLVSDQAGMGLGGLLKTFRQFPQMSLAEAIQRLPSPTENSVPQNTTSHQTTYQPLVLASANQSTFTGKSMLIMAISACVTVGIIAFFYQRNNQRIEEIARQQAAQQVLDEQQKALEATNIQSTAAVATATSPEAKTEIDDVNAKARRMQEELAKLEEEKKLIEQTTVVTPDDFELFGKMPHGKPVSVRGLVKLVINPPGTKGIYISFSDPWDGKQVRAVIYVSNFEGGIYTEDDIKKIEAEYQNLVGKTVLISGTASNLGNRPNPSVIRIVKKSDIKIEDAQALAATGQTKEFYSPDDGELFKALDPKTQVKLRGTLKTIKYNENMSAIVFLFSSPFDPQQIRGVIHKVNFKDTFDIKPLEKLIDKEIVLDGRFIKSDDDILRVEVTEMNQITVVTE